MKLFLFSILAIWVARVSGMYGARSRTNGSSTVVQPRAQEKGENGGRGGGERGQKDSTASYRQKGNDAFLSVDPDRIYHRIAGEFDDILRKINKVKLHIKRFHGKTLLSLFLGHNFDTWFIVTTPDRFKKWREPKGSLLVSYFSDVEEKIILRPKYMTVLISVKNLNKQMHKMYCDYLHQYDDFLPKEIFELTEHLAAGDDAQPGALPLTFLEAHSPFLLAYTKEGDDKTQIMEEGNALAEFFEKHMDFEGEMFKGRPYTSQRLEVALDFEDNIRRHPTKVSFVGKSPTSLPGSPLGHFDSKEMDEFVAEILKKELAEQFHLSSWEKNEHNPIFLVLPFSMVFVNGLALAMRFNGMNYLQVGDTAYIVVFAPVLSVPSATRSGVYIVSGTIP